MSDFMIILQQLVQFALILAVGFLAAKTKIITEPALPVLSQMFSKVLLPVYIFVNTVESGTFQMLVDNVPIMVFSLSMYLVLILLFFLAAKLLPGDREHRNVFQSLFVFGNIGLVGIPLIQALYPQDGPLYIALISIVDQLFMWTYGLYLTSGETKLNPRRFLNPAVIFILLAVAVLVLELRLPAILMKTCRALGGAASPVCFLYMGAMIFFARPADALKHRDLYLGIAVKMIAFPLLLGMLLQCFDIPASMAGTLVIVAALPTMSVMPLLVPAHSKEKSYAVGAALATILLSLVTIPLVMYLYERLL